MFEPLLASLSQRTLQVGLLVFLLSPTISYADDIPIVQQWRGQSRDNTLKAAAPVNGMITDAKSWNKLWQKWRGDTDVKTPEIDFDANLVIVALAHGPNNVSVRTLERDEAGAVDYRAMSTRRGGPGFGYLFMEVPRDGIKSVQKHPLPAAGAIASPSENRPGAESPAGPELPRGGEFIHATIVGTLQTGIVAIGGESTGTTITARDITWELDLTQDRGLQRMAEKLQGQRVKVTGLLRRKRGVEIAERWIVAVASLDEQKQ